jgi:hypothetical protein
VHVPADLDVITISRPDCKAGRSWWRSWIMPERRSINLPGAVLLNIHAQPDVQAPRAARARLPRIRA